MLIRHAESNGQITGLNTNARRLSDMDYVAQLVEAGLDHVQVTVESCNEQIHDEMMRAKGAFKQTIAGLKNALASNLYVMTNTTILHTNVHTIPDTLDFLADVGVPTIGLNVLIYSGYGLTVGTGLRENELQSILDIATQKTSERGQRLIWYTPTQYCEFDPTANNLGVKGCTAALYSMCIESNGNVLPCQTAPKLVKYDLKDIGMSCGGGISVFLEPLVPATQLIIFGAGHIGSALSQIGKLLDFNVTVVDNRPEFANAGRLPWADTVVAADYQETLKGLSCSDNTYMVIVTHKHAHDYEILESLIHKPFRYLGVIGSRTKVAKVFQQLRDKGIRDESIARIFLRSA